MIYFLKLLVENKSKNSSKITKIQRKVSFSRSHSSVAKNYSRVQSLNFANSIA